MIIFSIPVVSMGFSQVMAGSVIVRMVKMGTAERVP